MTYLPFLLSALSLPSTTLALLLPHRTVLAAALQDHSPFIILTSLLKPTNIVSTTIHISPINKFRVVDVPSMSKHSTACLRRLRVHDEQSKSVIYYRTYLPRCASGYTPHGQAVRACAPFQILTLIRTPIPVQYYCCSGCYPNAGGLP